MPVSVSATTGVPHVTSSGHGGIAEGTGDCALLELAWLALTPQTPLAAPSAETHAEAAPQGGCVWPPTDADDGEGLKWPPSKAQFTGSSCSSQVVSGEVWGSQPASIPAFQCMW